MERERKRPPVISLRCVDQVSIVRVTRSVAGEISTVIDDDDLDHGDRATVADQLQLVVDSLRGALLH